MNILTKSDYVGRSLQKRKPLKEIISKPLHEKYTMIIDKYLFYPIKLQNAQICKYNNFSSTFQSENYAFNPLNQTDYKLPRFPCSKRRTRDKSHDKKPKTCTTPSFFKVEHKIMQKYRAKSMQFPKKGKKTANMQTDYDVIIENCSQEEESPVKMQPMYM